MRYSVVTGVRLDPQTHAKLLQIVKETKMKRSQIIRELVEFIVNHYDRIMDYEDIAYIYLKSPMIVVKK